MIRRTLAVIVVTLLVAPLAQAQFKQGDWALTLQGQGGNDNEWRTGQFSVNGSLSYFLNDQMELGVRQGVNWSDGGSSWGGDTRVAFDYNFDLDRWVPFIGANIGYMYGDQVNDAWIAGPEAGIKYFVNPTTFIELVAAYEWNLNDGIDKGAYFYGLGVGFKF